MSKQQLEKVSIILLSGDTEIIYTGQTMSVLPAKGDYLYLRDILDMDVEDRSSCPTITIVKDRTFGKDKNMNTQIFLIVEECNEIKLDL